ncbi:ribosomal protein S5 domain 2-type protein [Gongronella butleri]|nr:ribosomal protein S5 domain 2-type protein [Gongronella butleri]
MRTVATLQPRQVADELLQEREKPESLSYFTGNFKYNDLLIDLDRLYKQHAEWKPVEVADETSAVAQKAYSWKLREKMSQMLGIPLKTSQWRKITLHLNQLASLPRPLPPQVEQLLQAYERSMEQATGVTKQSKTIDDLGRAYAVGRRKESSARCWVVEGEGKIMVNGIELKDYFQRPVDQDKASLPLEAIDAKNKFNVWSLVEGGGQTGQAEAIKLGIGRALLIHDNEWKPILRKAGCITRDPRVVERKKEGQRKARAKYTW